MAQSAYQPSCEYGFVDKHMLLVHTDNDSPTVLFVTT